uniref:Uncharacterized protein n=1 Tax=Oryza glumipatula TaxID=40148 RepID=A0A0D9ZU25_9ORYZ
MVEVAVPSKQPSWQPKISKASRDHQPHHHTHPSLRRPPPLRESSSPTTRKQKKTHLHPRRRGAPQKNSPLFPHAPVAPRRPARRRDHPFHRRIRGFNLPQLPVRSQRPGGRGLWAGMVGDLSSLLAAASSASPVVLVPSKELHGVHLPMPLQGKRPPLQPQDAAVHIEAAAAAAAAFQGQVMVPGHAHAGAPAAFQAFAVPDMAALIDVQADSHPDSVQLSLGIAEQCSRQEKILKFLRSGSDVKELDYLPENQLVIPDPLVEFFQSHGSALTIDQNGRILFNGNGDDMRYLLSIVLAFNMSKRETSSCKTAYLVPYFERKRRSRASSHASNSKLASTAVDASKSTANGKSKSSSKKKQKSKNIKERDLYPKNYFHASEAFLSMLLDKDNSSSTIHSLKKAGPEISELLTKCSIGIAGTGLAVLLSVVCKMATGMKSPIAATRLVNTGVGLGLFWLSWAVNGLRDTITSIFRSPGDMNLKDEEVAVRIQKSMNDILFRAITILAITAFKFA